MSEQSRFEVRTLRERARARAAGFVGATEDHPVLFQGVDTVENVRLDAVVTGSTEVTEYPTGTSETGGHSVASYTCVTSFEELCRSLSIDAKATAAYGATGHATAKMKFAQDLKMTTYSVVAVAYARQCTATTQAVAYGFVDQATFDRIQSDPAGFARLHGDAWAKSVETGGEYYAAYVFYCQSAEQQTEVRAKFEAGAAGSSVDFDAALSEAMTSHHAETRFFTEVSGGPAEGPPANADEIAEYAVRFLTVDLEAPVVFDHTTLGYERTTCDGEAPTAFEPVAANRRRLVEGDDSYAQQLADLDTIIAQCHALVGTADDNVNHEAGIYRFYGYADDAVTAALEQAKADRAEVKAWFDVYAQDPTAAIPDPLPLASIAQGAPEPRVRYEALKLAGTSGHGHFFSDLDEDGLGAWYCSNHRRVARIGTHNNNDGIGLLETAYDDPTGIGGASQLVYRRGGPSYTAECYHVLGEDDTITRIDVYTKERRMHGGHHWMCVTALIVHYVDAHGNQKTFRSSAGFMDGCSVTTYAFGDQPDGTRTVFVGWQGYAEEDGHVFGLAPVQATLEPAAWPDARP